MNQSSSEPSNARTGPTGLTESDRHRLLASERRRVAIEVLSETGPPYELEALATAVAEREAGPGGAGIDVGRVAITLHHQHLPMLTDAEVVEYVPRTKRVEAVHASADLL